MAFVDLDVHSAPKMASGQLYIDGIPYNYTGTDTVEEIIRRNELGGCSLFAVTRNKRWDALSSFVSPSLEAREIDYPLHTHPVRLNGIPFWVTNEEGATPVVMHLSYSFVSDDVPALITQVTGRYSVITPSIGDIEDFLRQYIIPKGREEKPFFGKKKLRIAYQYGKTATEVQFFRPGSTIIFDKGTILDNLTGVHTFKYSEEGEKAYSARIDWNNWINKDEASVGLTKNDRHVLDGTYPVNPNRGSSKYKESMREQGLISYFFRSTKDPLKKYRLFFSLDDGQYHVSAGDFLVYSGNTSFDDDVAEDAALATYMQTWRPHLDPVPKKARYDCSCTSCREGRPQECSIGT